MMSLRENVAVGLKPVGFNFHYDVSIPIKDMYNLVEKIGARLADIEGAVCCGFGHIGDNDLHISPIVPHYDRAALDLLEPYIYEEVAALGGSVSSEHGMGLKKAQYLKYSRDQGVIETMRLLKNTFDPNAIMNPYKVLPWDI